MLHNDVVVSIVMPVLNEEKYMDTCISSVLAQDFDKNKIEFLLVDGMSIDKTASIIRAYAQKYKFIRLLENPNRTVQCALNIGIRNAVGTYVVRMDAHTEYATDYVSKCVQFLESTGADNVGGPMVPGWRSTTQKVIAAAYHSNFALGGGKFHDENFTGYADTVYLGAFKRETLLKIGLYDERLPRSEDDDLNYRITKANGKVFITPNIKSVYYPRDSYLSLFKQYYEYGLWKVAVIKKHKKPARLSHLVPVAFLLFILVFSLLSFVLPPIKLFFFCVLALYLAIDAFFSFSSPYVSLFIDKVRLVWVHFILHISYGLGFLHGIFRFLPRKF